MVCNLNISRWQLGANVYLLLCVNMLKFKVLCFDGHMALKGVCEYFEIWNWVDLSFKAEYLYRISKAVSSIIIINYCGNVWDYFV